MQHPETDVLTRVIAAIRSAATNPLPNHIDPSHSFILDLSFDSLSVVMLSLALENEFGYPILLDEWIALRSEPTGLTVGSLCDYLTARLESHG